MNRPDSSLVLKLLTASGLALIFLVLYVPGFNDLSVGFTSDDAVYLLLADLYTFSAPAEWPVYQVIREQALFPPLFPLVLGLLGGGSEAPALSAAISIILLFLSLLVAGYWMFQQSRNLALTFVLTGLLFLLPGTLILAREIWSEFLFMLLLYTIFIVTGRECSGRYDWLLTAILIALATLTRTIGIALLPPFYLLLYRHRVKGFLIPVLVSTLPFLFWYLTREILTSKSGYTGIVSPVLTNPAILPEMLLTKLLAMFNSTVWLFSAIDDTPLHYRFTVFFVLLMLALATSGLLQALKKSGFEVLFAMVYCSIIFIWPFEDPYYVSRFLYPLMPVLLFHACHTLSGIKQKKLALTARLLLACTFLLVAGPSINQITRRVQADVAPELKPYRQDRTWLLANDANENLLANTRFIIETLHTIRTLVPVNECIYAVQSPLVMLHTLHVTGILPAADIPDDQFRNETSSCRYILALPMTAAGMNTPEYYPLNRINLSDYEQSVFYQNPQTGRGASIHLLQRIADTNPPK